MKSPQTLTVFIIAIIFAGIGFVVASTIGANSTVVAVSVFIAALLSPFLASRPIKTKNGSDSNESDDVQNGDVKTLYVGNLPYRANETSVRELFSEHGVVHSVRLMKDKHTGKRRGFGFVEMSATDLDQAVSALNDTEFQQRTLKVREAKERPEKEAAAE
jgi:RNA recognition motif-containing protein